MKFFIFAVAVLLLQLCGFAPASAHELRPAYLDIRETAAEQYFVQWKVPALGDRRLSLGLRLPDNCTATEEPGNAIEDGGHFQRSLQACAGGLAGQEIAIDGLNSTLTDVLVRIGWSGGGVEMHRLKPDTPVFTVEGAQTWSVIAVSYFRLGVDHILSGIDHLLFVLALMLLISSGWMLVKTITAFTIAHSITLSGAALGHLSLPQAPVEAVIALSIVFVASELLKLRGDGRRLSQSYPWMVAFAFGILHGFGFAGALKEIGLPQTDVPLALVTFNIGVEAGQLLFVGAVLLAYRLFTLAVAVPRSPALTVGGYSIGIIAAFWLIERLFAFVA